MRVPSLRQRPQTGVGLVWVGLPRQVRITHKHRVPLRESQFIVGDIFLPCRYHPVCLQVHGQKQQTPRAPRPSVPLPLPQFSHQTGKHPASSTGGCWGLSCDTPVQYHSSWTCSRICCLGFFHWFLFFNFLKFCGVFLMFILCFNLMMKLLAPSHWGLGIRIPKQLPHGLCSETKGFNFE